MGGRYLSAVRHEMGESHYFILQKEVGTAEADSNTIYVVIGPETSPRNVKRQPSILPALQRKDRTIGAAKHVRSKRGGRECTKCRIAIFYQLIPAKHSNTEI